MKRKYLIVISTFVISSCSVGPDYQQPSVNAPQKFVSQNVFEILNEGEISQEYPIQWWYGFNDQILNDLVDKGLSKNYTIASAAARVRQARANIQLEQSDDNLRVTIDGDAGLQEQRELGGSASSTSSSIASGLAAVLPIDVFGRTRRQIEAARAELEFAEADLRGSILDISTEIASEYLGLRGNQRQLDLLKESVELQQKTLSIVRSRYEAGLAPELDLQRARTSVENLQAEVPLLEQSLKNSRNILATLAGEFPGYYESLLSENTTIPDYDSPIPQLVPLEVLGLRPDVAQAEARLKQAIANIGVAETEFYPVFQLSGGIGIEAGLGGTAGTDVLIATLRGLIEQVLLDGGARDANLQIATAQAEETLAEYENTLREAGLDVETSLAALQASLARQEFLENSVQSSSRSFAQAEILYQQGLISFLDVVDAQRQFASAEQSLARERTNYVTEISNLFRVLGGLKASQIVS